MELKYNDRKSIFGACMSKQWSLWSFLVLFFPSAIVLGIHAYIGSFNRYIADDFCSIYFSPKSWD